MNLADFRKEYSAKGLHRTDLSPNPIEAFESWFRQATDLKVHEPNAMTLATVSPDGQPSQRTVLLKAFDERGFVFYSNYSSRKAREIAANPAASLLFPWITLERQIIIRGKTEKITRQESVDYFHSRPRDSQLGAWVSDQSTVIPSREFLVRKLDELKTRFGEARIPLPDDWGGYRVIPDTIEFWQGGSARIHDRFLYTRQEDTWKTDRLSP